MNIYTLIVTFIEVFLWNLTACSQEILKDLLPYKIFAPVKNIQYDRLGDECGKSSIKIVDDHTLYVKLFFVLKEEVRQNAWQIAINPNFIPTFCWAPHLTPTDRSVIDQHVFRSPCLIMSDSINTLILIPDLDIMRGNNSVHWYMDMDALSDKIVLGMCNNHVVDHVLFERDDETIYPVGQYEIGFYLMYYKDKKVAENPFRKSLGFLWQQWGHQLYADGNPVKDDLGAYAEYAYKWPFNSWRKNVWQQFELNGKKVGAPVFIVNITQSPNYPGEVNERGFRSIWNQVWFSSLRSASGLFRYARRTGDNELLAKANLAKELAFSFPQREGFFYGLIGTEMCEVEIGGEKYNRSKGWDTYFWGNSNRNPHTWNPKDSPFHILDMSWTALLMLCWYEELEKDPRLLSYVENYAQALLKKQFKDGFFLGWLDLQTMQSMEYLNNSPESSLSVIFLLALYEQTGKYEYKDAALKAMDAAIEKVIPFGRWKDFETYWSCSHYGANDLVGKKVVRNDIHKQNNLSMFWTTEALYECFHITQNDKYLKYGERTLDEMLMSQASWQPPYMYVNVLDGFGVLNADGEWNDSRESLFAELIIKYGKLLNRKEYIERGYAALKASFVMMYFPENPQTKQQWEKVYPFFRLKIVDL